MPDYGQEVRFGVFITPAARDASAVVELARLADLVGLDLVSFQDHPYQSRFLDTWTLLSYVAAVTTNVALAPNVVNLPLRPPAVLARSVATLDILSGGRAELGLGAGAFWDGVAAMGGTRLTPGASVDALAEAIAVIRGLWDTARERVDAGGEHHRVTGAATGPAPLHDVEIWLGAYKPRMLRLTGEQADGWVPTMGYADPHELAPLNAAIDAAASEAGRDPSVIRRLYNVTTSDPELLAELALDQGMSTFVLAVSSEAEVRTFAEEVAPAVRRLVDAGRTGAPAPAARTAAGPGAVPFAVVPTPDDGTRLAAEPPWDEDDRPTGPAPEPGRLYTADQQAAGQHLVDVHDHLRHELAQLRQLIDQLARGTVDPTTVSSFINRMTIRQNNWTLGVYCASYCRMVTGHHTLEDTGIFPHLRRAEPELVPVVDRLAAEHEVIAELIDALDGAVVGLVSKSDLAHVREALDRLTDAMGSHLSYEERELVEPLSRLGFY